MSPLQWVVIGQCVLGTLFQVVLIGKPRQPITPTAAAYGFVVNGIIVVMALTVLAP